MKEMIERECAGHAGPPPRPAPVRGTRVQHLAGEDRQQTVGVLAEAFEHVCRDRKPRLVSLEAELGWGKTAIVRSFYEHLAAGDRNANGYWPPAFDDEHRTQVERRKRIYPGAMRVQERRPPYAWWGIACGRREDGDLGQVLASDITQIEAHAASLLLDQDLAKQGADVLLRLAKRVATLLPGLDLLLDAPDVIDDARALRDLVRKAVTKVAGTGKAREVDAEGTGRLKVVERALDLLKLFADNDVPSIVVIDDAHHADPSVIELLKRIFGACDLPLLVVCCAWTSEIEGQAEGHSDLALGHWLTRLGGPGATRIPLPAMSDAALAEIVTKAAPSTDAEVTAAFVRRSGGNPLVLDGLLALDVVKVTAEGSIAMSVEEVDGLPGNWPDIVSAQWNRLDEEVRKVLRCASIQGLDFLHEVPLRVAAEVLGLADSDQHLREAEDPRRWVTTEGAHLRFSERARYDVANGTVGQSFTSRQLEQAHAVIARLITEARHDPSWRSRPEPERRMLLRAMLRLAKAPVASETRGSATRMEQRREREEFDDALAELWALERLGGSLADAAEVARARCEIAEGLDDPARRLARLEELAWVLRDAGEYEAALTATRDVVDCVEDLEDLGLSGGGPVQTLWARNDLATVYCDLGRWEEAVPIGREVAATAAAVLGDDDPRVDALARNNLAIYLRCLAERGDGNPRSAELKEAREIQRGVVDRAAGRDDPSISFLKSDLALTEAEIECGVGSMGAAYAALRHAGANDDNFAGRDYFLRLAERWFKGLGAEGAQVTVLERLGTLAYDQGRHHRAAEMYRKALDLAERAGPETVATHTLADLARWLDHDGHPADAARARKLLREGA